MILFKNILISENRAVTSKDLLVDNGVIKDIGFDLIKKYKAKQIFDFEGKGLALAGACDVHVHLREPGYEYKEDIYSGTSSASKGGVTAVLAMPNTNPATDSAEKILHLKSLIDKNASVAVYPFSAITKGQKGNELVDIEGISEHTKFFTDDGVGVNDLTLLKEAMLRIKQIGGIIASHAEAEGELTSEEMETVAVEREIALVKETGAKYHFCHISLKKSLQLIEDAQKSGCDISCEIAPHHLFLSAHSAQRTAHNEGKESAHSAQRTAHNEGNINKDSTPMPYALCPMPSNYKMNPPLRSHEDMLYCREALLKGVATIVATDHAPHSREEKARSYENAPNGIIGLETMIPLLYTNFVKTGLASVEDLLNWVSVNPRARFGIPKAEIKIGSKADFTIIDTQTTRAYTESENKSKSANSPFFGQEMCGFTLFTIYNGKIIYNSKEV
ncbi:MAG: dihydroorotase [Firmicutes bacterium]|nr:dihydroorotase [Bacillota bacterium]